MTEEHLRSHLQLGELNQRASAATSALLQKANTADAPDLRHLALARKLFLGLVLGTLGLVIGAVLLVSFLASGALPWIVGSILVVADRRSHHSRAPCRRPRLVRPAARPGPGGSMGVDRIGGRLDLCGRLGTRRAGLHERGAGGGPRGPCHRLPSRPVDGQRPGCPCRCRRHNPEPSGPDGQSSGQQ